MKNFTVISAGGTVQSVYQVVSDGGLYAERDGSKFYVCQIKRIAEELLAKPGHSDPVEDEPYFALIELLEYDNSFSIEFSDRNEVFVKAAFYNRVLPEEHTQAFEGAEAFVQNVETSGLFNPEFV